MIEQIHLWITGAFILGLNVGLLIMWLFMKESKKPQPQAPKQQRSTTGAGAQQ